MRQVHRLPPVLADWISSNAIATPAALNPGHLVPAVQPHGGGGRLGRGTPRRAAAELEQPGSEQLERLTFWGALRRRRPVLTRCCPPTVRAGHVVPGAGATRRRPEAPPPSPSVKPPFALVQTASAPSADLREKLVCRPARRAPVKCQQHLLTRCAIASRLRPSPLMTTGDVTRTRWVDLCDDLFARPVSLSA